MQITKALFFELVTPTSAAMFAFELRNMVCHIFWPKAKRSKATRRKRVVYLQAAWQRLSTTEQAGRNWRRKRMVRAQKRVKLGFLIFPWKGKTTNTYKNFVCRAATIDHTFASAHFHRFLP